MSVLRPRDIQTRIRAGETPEDVAAAAQTSVDKIMGFATPVLAERAYQAQLAQRASVRRRAATGHVGNLGAAVTSHLEALEIDPDSVEWDAWRRDDGRWTVVAAYVARGEHHQAAFSYDAAGRFVVAEDDEARALVGERSRAAAEAPVAAAEPAGPAADPLDDLLPPRHDEDPATQLELGDDAMRLVTGLQPVPPEPTEPAAPAVAAGGSDHDDAPATTPAPEPAVAELQGEVTLDLTDTTAAVRAAGPSATGDADWIATQATERPATPSEPPAPRGDEADPEEDVHREEEQPAEALFEVPAAAERSVPASRSRGRASVPSWDEIMFGTPRSE